MKNLLHKITHQPGVYLFKDEKDTVLYVGKAKDLRRRVSQYFQANVEGKTALLVAQIKNIQTIPTASEFDALILEAKLIHDLAPKYNLILKDDKSPLYILITLSEAFPRVLTVRQRDLAVKMSKGDVIYGPFQSARVVRTMLRHLRYSLPYCTQTIRTGRPCFWSHLGLCDPCPSGLQPDRKRYRQNILRLTNILNGKSNQVMKDLERNMQLAAKTQNFEEAAKFRKYLRNLKQMLSRHYDPELYLQSDTALKDIGQTELSALAKLLGISHLQRIECIDISNLQGTFATGSLVVLTDGRPDNSEYRRFKIRQTGQINDVAMIREVIARRFTHPEWPKPDLLVIDGGKGQVRAAQFAPVPVIGLAKREEEIIVPKGSSWKTIRLSYTSPALHLVQRIRDEAHRFALSYHRILRKKANLLQ